MNGAASPKRRFVLNNDRPDPFPARFECIQGYCEHVSFRCGRVEGGVLVVRQDLRRSVGEAQRNTYCTVDQSGLGLLLLKQLERDRALARENGYRQAEAVEISGVGERATNVAHSVAIHRALRVLFVRGLPVKRVSAETLSWPLRRHGAVQRRSRIPKRTAPAFRDG